MASPRVSGLRLDAILMQAREPAFLLGPDRRLLGANRAFEALTGRAAEGGPATAWESSDPRADALDAIAGPLRPPPEAFAGGPAGGPTLIVRSGGDHLWRRAEYWPLHDADGSLLAVFGLIRRADAAPHAPESPSQTLRAELAEARRRSGPDPLIGRGPAHSRLLTQVRAAAVSGLSVLIVGEPGTGKRAVARAVHASGPSVRAPYLAFDCAALPPELLERELFGREGRADETIGDAPPSRGPVHPDGTTIVLSEILDLPRDLQARLAAEPERGFRLAATTTGDPEAAVQAGRLRADFYHAISAIILRLDPLRDRLDELPLLALHLLERANGRGGRRLDGFTSEALDALAAYDWPGNLLELSRVVDTAHAAAASDLVGIGDLPPDILGQRAGAFLPPPPPDPLPLDDRLNELERRLILQAMARAGQNKSRAAESLGISRPRLYRRIKELSIPDDPEPGTDPPADDEPAGLPA